MIDDALISGAEWLPCLAAAAAAAALRRRQARQTASLPLRCPAQGIYIADALSMPVHWVSRGPCQTTVLVRSSRFTAELHRLLLCVPLARGLQHMPLPAVSCFAVL